MCCFTFAKSRQGKSDYKTIFSDQQSFADYSPKLKSNMAVVKCSKNGLLALICDKVLRVYDLK